jgi:hypothetical protein
MIFKIEKIMDLIYPIIIWISLTNFKYKALIPSSISISAMLSSQKLEKSLI